MLDLFGDWVKRQDPCAVSFARELRHQATRLAQDAPVETKWQSEQFLEQRVEFLSGHPLIYPKLILPRIHFPVDGNGHDRTLLQMPYFMQE